MKKALFLTAFNRPQYLEPTLQHWKKVRGLRDWHIRVQIEPSDLAYLQTKMIEHYLQGNDLDIQVNPEVYGVLHNPWVGFDHLFNNDYDFVVRAEDDLIVSTDIIEYFNWAARVYEKDKEIATVHAFTEDDGDISAAIRMKQFSPLVWGTWKDRWEEYIGPTWDHDYSTFNESPGNQAGWDWNLNTRVLPALNKQGIYPLASRVDNIGAYGTHSDPNDYVTAKSFVESRGRIGYHEITTV